MVFSFNVIAADTSMKSIKRNDIIYETGAWNIDIIKWKPAIKEDFETGKTI